MCFYSKSHGGCTSIHPVTSKPQSGRSRYSACVDVFERLFSPHKTKNKSYSCTYCFLNYTYIMLKIFFQKVACYPPFNITDCSNIRIKATLVIRKLACNYELISILVVTMTYMGIMANSPYRILSSLHNVQLLGPNLISLAVVAIRQYIYSCKPDMACCCRGGSGNQKLVRPIAAPNPFQKKECTKILE